jgi:creatinine amidohydrolase
LTLALKSHWWWDHTTRDFATLPMDRIVAVQPIAAIEQHGPHLPVRVDAAINAGIVARAVELMPADMPVLVMPMMPVGKSNEHHAFPGTLSLSYETLARLWYELGESAHRAGCQKILYFNAHGGQPQVMDIVTRELRVKLGMLAAGCSWFRSIDKSDLFDAKEIQHGIHGGEVETAMMLHLHGDLVEMDRAEDFAPLSIAIEEAGGILTPEGRVGFGWQTQDLHGSGACGNAADADAERGRLTVERAAETLVKLLGEIVDYPMERVTQKTWYNEG